MSSIGYRIKKRRLELGLSVDQVAEKLGKNRATVYRYEGDEIENLPVAVIEPLAQILYTTPAYLMGWGVDASTEQDSAENENRAVFSANLRHYMQLCGRTRTDVCDALGFAYKTFAEWEKGITYPRIDEIETLAYYFGIKTSDLTESHDTTQQPDISQIYLSFARSAQEQGISPKDIELAIDMIKRFRGQGGDNH